MTEWWPGVHRQDTAEETEGKAEWPSTTPAGIQQDEANQPQEEEGPSFTSQEAGEKKGT